MAGNIFEETVRPVLSPEKYGPELWPGSPAIWKVTDNLDGTYTAQAEIIGWLQGSAVVSGTKYELAFYLESVGTVDENNLCLAQIGGAAGVPVATPGRYRFQAVAVDTTPPIFIYVGAAWLGKWGDISFREVL